MTSYDMAPSLRTRSGRVQVRLSMVVIAVLAVVLVAGAGSARADISYCNMLVPPKSACSRNSGSTRILSNSAWYNGYPAISVCQRVNRTIDGYQVSRTCGSGWADSPTLDYEYYYNVKTIGTAGNDSNYTHTINAATFSDESSLAATVAPSFFSIPSSLGVMRTTDASDGSVTAISGGRQSVKLRTTERGLCLEAVGVGGSCAPPPAAAAGGLLGVSVCAPDLPPDTIAVYGVVPNGVTAVVARSADGSALATAPVQNNAFRFSMFKSSAAGAVTLTWEGKAGSSSLGDVIPDDDLGCG